jgi:hypothetical protein
MEKALIAALLEKYWQAETTIEEEKILADYFRQDAIPAEWEEYRDVFGFFEEESKLTVGADFDKRMLEKIAATERTVVMRSAVMRHAPWWAAAAVILLSLGGALLFDSPDRGGMDGAGKGSVAPARVAKTEITDTFDDPQEALAAIQKALAVAGKHINEGRNITKKEFSHFNALNYAINN